MNTKQSITKPLERWKGHRWFFLLTAALCLAFQMRVGFAQAPLFEWAVQAGGMRDDYGAAIVMDATTNLYVAGSFSGTAIFGTTNITAASTNINDPNFFLAKYDRSGNVQWVKRLGGCCAQEQSIAGIALDGAGNIYMAGGFRGTLSMGNFTERSDYSHHIFVAKLSNDGTVVWLEQGGDVFRHVSCTGMAADSDGNLYIAGSFDTTATFGHVTLEANEGAVYQVKYGPLGNVIWARKLGPPPGRSGLGYPGIVAATQDGHTYWTGSLYGELDFDGIIAAHRTDTNEYATFIAEYNNIGTAIRVITVDGLHARGQNGAVGPVGVRLDSDSNLYVVGYFNGAARFDGQIITNQAYYDSGFIAKYNPARTLDWVTSFTNASPSGFAMDSTGNLYITGNFTGYADFDRIRLPGTGIQNLFVAKYDVTGTVTWAKRAGGNYNTYSSGIVVEPGEALFLTGGFTDGAGFDNIVLAAAGPSRTADIFLAKLSLGKPIITSQPQHQTVALGGTATFTVSATNNPPFIYQWQFQGTNLVNETNATLTIPNVQSSNEGPYRVIVGNAVGTTVSAWATLTLIAPLAITAQPQSQIVVAGTNATFSVTASGTTPLTYRWLFNGTNLAGATSRTLVISNVEPSNAGSYSVLITNVQGAVTSSIATLTVRYSLTIDSNGNGTVTRNPNFTIYPPGLSVTLTATPSPGSAFRNWSGDASGSTNPLTIVMTTNKSITANFVSTAIAIAIVGEGTVTKFPDQPFYNVGDSVTLTATPGRWHAFTRWGDGPTVNPRVITIGTSNSYTAIFSPTTAVETLTFNNVSRTAPVGMPAIFIEGEFAVTGAASRLDSAEVSMLTTFANGSIFYTLDGSAPSFGASLYGGPFVACRSATIRAIAYDADFAASWEADPVELTIEPTFEVNATTAGGGGVGASPAAASYRRNTLVTLSATPAPGWTFLQWLGDASGTSVTTSVRVLNRDLCARALFGTTLGTTVAGNGSVVVGPVAAFYPYGTAVRLTAVPQSGSYFGAWGNAVMSTNNPLLFTVTNANPTVSCAFGTLSGGQVALTVLVHGHGRVTTNPRGNRFPNNQSITLTAIPDADQEFLGWSGDATGASTNLTVLLTQSKIIEANFTMRPRLSVGPCLGGWREDGFQLALTGILGGHYSIEKSTNARNWTPLVTLTNMFGTLQFTDVGATNRPRQFYRGMLEP